MRPVPVNHGSAAHVMFASGIGSWQLLCQLQMLQSLELKVYNPCCQSCQAEGASSGVGWSPKVLKKRQQCPDQRRWVAAF